MSNQNLVKFLQNAKRKTFASLISFSRSTSDGGKEYTYQEGDFVYKDKYFGSVVDTGQELVWHQDKLIWSMAYRGGDERRI